MQKIFVSFLTNTRFFGNKKEKENRDNLPISRFEKDESYCHMPGRRPIYC